MLTENRNCPEKLCYTLRVVSFTHQSKCRAQRERRRHAHLGRREGATPRSACSTTTRRRTSLRDYDQYWASLTAANAAGAASWVKDHSARAYYSLADLSAPEWERLASSWLTGDDQMQTWQVQRMWMRRLIDGAADVFALLILGFLSFMRVCRRTTRARSAAMRSRCRRRTARSRRARPSQCR